LEIKTETQPVYEVWVNRESAIEDGSAHFWVEKFIMYVDLKVRGSELRTGYTLFPRGQCIVKFAVENEELTPEDLAKILEQMVQALTEPFRMFVKIEDKQENMRKEDF